MGSARGGACGSGSCAEAAAGGAAVQAQAELLDRRQRVAAQLAVASAPVTGVERHAQLAVAVLAGDGERLGAGEVAPVAGQQRQLDPHVALVAAVLALV